MILKKIRIWIHEENFNHYLKLTRVSSISCLKIVMSFNKQQPPADVFIT